MSLQLFTEEETRAQSDSQGHSARVGQRWGETPGLSRQGHSAKTIPASQSPAPSPSVQRPSHRSPVGPADNAPFTELPLLHPCFLCTRNCCLELALK